MLKKELYEKLASAKEEVKNALQLVYSELNQGQQKKLLKDETIKALFDRYGVEY